MNLQEEIKALKQRISELEQQAEQEKEFPKRGDKYHFIEANGRIDWFQWDESSFGLRAQDLGNIYKTDEEAQFVREKLKVEAELRKFSRPFKEGENRNWFILWNTYEQDVEIDWAASLVRQGTIYFESKEKVQQAISTVGEERIKKYLFGVED